MSRHSALAPLTEQLHFLVDVRLGLQSRTMAARMTATLDRISAGRRLINVVTGDDSFEKICRARWERARALLLRAATTQAQN